MAVWIEKEMDTEEGHIVHVKIHSACCKKDLFFIEDRPNHFLYFDSRLPIDPGMAETIIKYRGVK